MSGAQQFTSAVPERERSSRTGAADLSGSDARRGKGGGPPSNTVIAAPLNAGTLGATPSGKVNWYKQTAAGIDSAAFLPSEIPNRAVCGTDREMQAS